jgi:hypothetical protein
MLIIMLAAKIKTKMIVSWCNDLSEPRRTVLTSPPPPRPAPRLAPRVCSNINIVNKTELAIVM